jgi:Holliday junction resolvase
MTPEGKVKTKVNKLLESYNAYRCMPLTNGYGASGVPDILACLHGRFIGIECKAGSNKPTALQQLNLNMIRDRGGVALVINENNLELLENELKRICESNAGTE